MSLGNPGNLSKNRLEVTRFSDWQVILSSSTATYPPPPATELPKQFDNNFWVCYIATAPAQMLIHGFFLPKNFRSSYPSSTNRGHSPRVFQSESSEHRNKQAQRELGWELAVDFSILRHGFRHGFPRKMARILFRKLAWI